MCFVNNKIQHEPLTITVTLIFVSVRSVFKIIQSGSKFLSKILNLEKYFLDCLTKNWKIFFSPQM